MTDVEDISKKFRYVLLVVLIVLLVCVLLYYPIDLMIDYLGSKDEVPEGWKKIVIGLAILMMIAYVRSIYHTITLFKLLYQFTNKQQ